MEFFFFGVKNSLKICFDYLVFLIFYENICLYQDKQLFSDFMCYVIYKLFFSVVQYIYGDFIDNYYYYIFDIVFLFLNYYLKEGNKN